MLIKFHDTIGCEMNKAHTEQMDELLGIYVTRRRRKQRPANAS